MKRLLIAVLLVLFGVSAVVFYLWRQATQLPSWYTETSNIETTNPDLTSPDQGKPDSSPPGKEKTQQGQAQQAQQAQKRVETKIAERVQQAPKRKQVDVELDQAEVRNLFTSEIARKAKSSQLGKAVKGVNTTVEDGKVESGAVVNLARVSIEQLPSHEQSILSKMRAAFPDLSDRDLYIGIEGTPSVKNGQVKLDEDVRVRVGNLSFTPAELSQRLGVPEEQIRKQIGLQLQLGKLKVSDFEFVGDRAVIRGTAE